MKKRVLAFIIDQIIYMLVVVAIIIYVASTKFAIAMFNTILNSVVCVVWAGPISILLNGWLISKYGGSLGKILVKIKIVGENGNYLNFWQAIFREYIAKTVSGLVLWLGFFWIFIGREHQTWHDMICNTSVVKK